jgi:integrase
MPTITQMLGLWVKDKKPTASLVSEWTLAVSRFVQMFSDLTINQITVSQVRDYRNLLQQLPSRARFEIRQMPLAAQVAITAKESLPTLSTASVNKALTGLRVILTHAAEELRLIDLNPAQSVKSIRRGKVKTRSYKSYTEDELKLIFNSPAFTGCESAKRRHVPGPLILQDHFYWILLLALYHGCRLEELGQFKCIDIKQEMNIWYLDIYEIDGETSVKNEESIRKVPLHPRLISLGFLQYVESAKAKSEWLFPDLPFITDESRTKAFSRYFGRYLDQIGLSDRSKVFHSFRHTFKTACRRAKISVAHQNALCGHEQQGMDAIYGEDYPSDVLLEEISKISFDLGPAF